MSHTITAVCATSQQLHDVSDELRSSGIASEQLYVDEDSCQIRVRITEASDPGVFAMIERHGATVKT
ncbi:hypothetical protein [Piscinibacter sakaiensis]|uniref:hypothetical protein n=1 Tax=Piscinibacter sakaiensis TaxID=1547922 RepID=UPI003AB0DE42